MSPLDRLIPTPRLLEHDEVDVAATPTQLWQAVRHGDLADSALARALFALRTLPERFAGRQPDPSLRLDDLRSTWKRPGFQVLVEEPLHEVAVGAIGKVWKLEIPFVHVPNADAFCAFREPGFVKVAWVLRVSQRDADESRLELELRVDATDEDAWQRFRRYFTLIGPASRFIRRSLLERIARSLERAGEHDHDTPLAGDELLPDAVGQLTDAITIHATPAAIWPWLVQMGARRAGFYSIDLLDNANRTSAREIHPELQHLTVGEVIPATPAASEGFEVLRIDEARALVLGGLFDAEAGRQLRFGAPRPAQYWHVTWAFALEPLDATHTRLRVRARAAFPPSGRLRAAWAGPAHCLMERAQLRNLAARVEGRVGKDDWREVLDGLGGAAAIAYALLTPFSRQRRSHWGLSAEQAARAFPGDDIVPDASWGWTHAVEIDAAADEVWPWVAQIGADRAGFYSYQWLEHLAGVDLVNAESIHPEWELHTGDNLLVHPKLAPLTVVRLEPQRWFVAHAANAEVSVSWLFMLEPLGEHECRFVSRYRCRTSPAFRARIEYGPWIGEPLGFAMDRRMMLGVKERSERLRVAPARRD